MVWCAQRERSMRRLTSKRTCTVRRATACQASQRLTPTTYGSQASTGTTIAVCWRMHEA